MNNNGAADIGGFYLGFANASGTGVGGYFTGQMAEVNFYDSAIDQVTVDTLFAAASNPASENQSSFQPHSPSYGGFLLPSGILKMRRWKPRAEPRRAKADEGFYKIIMDPKGPCSAGELSSRVGVGVETATASY